MQWGSPRRWGAADIEERLLARLVQRRLRRSSTERANAAGKPARSSSVPAVFREQEQLIGRYAPGRTFVDVACLWEVNGGCAFLAGEHGATEVTASDKEPANEEYEAEHARRSSRVRFQQADLHDVDQVAALGVHDVVWCSGFMYHTPAPHLAMANLLAITGEYLICGSKVIPPVPGLPGAAVYYPGLEGEQRRLYAPVSRTVANEPYRPQRHTANWFWGLSPEALLGLARSIRELAVVEEVHLPWCRRHDSYYAVLRVID